MAPFERALISVSDKRGVVELAKTLAAKGVEILSTGGTAKALRDAGVKVIDVSEHTGSPEIMDGRVKTLHPRVHGGLLMRETQEDKRQLESIGGKPIDLVVVNLYPFEQTVARNAPYAEVVENIDIGGPSMLRSAAKNHERVTVVVDPSDYPLVLEAMDRGTSLATRAELAAKVFQHTAAYDGAIAAYFTSVAPSAAAKAHEVPERAHFPRVLSIQLEKAYDCRYGENPHQRAAFYLEREAADGTLARAKTLDAGGKELSFNNIVDLDAALDAVREHDRPGVVIVKHTNPCGVAVADSLEVAFRTAREADSLSAFGGIVALNHEVDASTARAMVESFLECVIAPKYSDEALEVLRGKKNLRILATGGWLDAEHAALQWKRVSGGVAVQDRDASGRVEVKSGKVVTKRAPSADELASLDFAWRVCKHVKSNAIVFARPDRTIGIGAGQMSRVVSVEIAAKKAGDLAKGCAMASDAFFPFPDGIEAAAAAGITAIAQPGGSVKDNDVIARADELGLAMVLTGVRHFRH